MRPGQQVQIGRLSAVICARPTSDEYEVAWRFLSGGGKENAQTQRVKASRLLPMYAVGKKDKFGHHVGQEVEVNFYDAKRWRASHYSRLPAVVEHIDWTKGVATVQPLLGTGVSSEVDNQGQLCNQPPEPFEVPLERLEPPAVSFASLAERKHWRPVRGELIETAWREYEDDPLSWWSCRVLGLNGNGKRVRVLSMASGEVVWLRLEWCRPMKRI